MKNIKIQTRRRESKILNLPLNSEVGNMKLTKFNFYINIYSMIQSDCLKPIYILTHEIATALVCAKTHKNML